MVCSAWKCVDAMKISVFLLTFADFAQHGLAVAPPEPGIDHQRGAGADDDADVRHEADVAVGDDVGVRRPA